MQTTQFILCYSVLLVSIFCICMNVPCARCASVYMPAYARVHMCVQIQAHACGGWKWQWASYLTALPFSNSRWHLLTVCVHLFVSNLPLSLTLSACRPVCVCVHTHTCAMTCLLWRSEDNFKELSLLLPTVFWRLNSACQSWWQTLFFSVHTTGQLLHFLWHSLLLSLPVSAFQVMELPVATNPACFRCEFCESELLILQVCGMCFIYRVNSSATSLLIYIFCFFFAGEYRAGHRRWWYTNSQKCIVIPITMLKSIGACKSVYFFKIFLSFS